MILAITSVVVLFLLRMNYAHYGPGCWGLQPGGRFSALLFQVQALLSLVALGWALYWLVKGRGRARFIVIGVAFAAAITAAFCYNEVGHRMFASIHGQGSENLPTFLLTSAVALLLGGYKWWLRAWRHRAGSQDASC